MVTERIKIRQISRRKCEYFQDKPKNRGVFVGPSVRFIFVIA